VVISATAEPRDPGLVITIVGHSFLPRMVRLLVGAALAYVEGRVSLEALRALLTNPAAKFTHPAPPQGLCLASVTY
jgi:tRNA pseudouridine(38-40) synthase